MKDIKLTQVLGIIGILLWAVTIFLRETSVRAISGMGFILGVMPNFAAVWFFASCVCQVYETYYKKAFTLKSMMITLGCIFIGALGSEIVHDLFLNSPFDGYDILVTIIAIVLFAGADYIQLKKSLSC